jgi:hypothetical protein
MAFCINRATRCFDTSWSRPGIAESGFRRVPLAESRHKRQPNHSSCRHRNALTLRGRRLVFGMTLPGKTARFEITFKLPSAFSEKRPDVRFQIFKCLSMLFLDSSKSRPRTKMDRLSQNALPTIIFRPKHTLHGIAQIHVASRKYHTVVQNVVRSGAYHGHERKTNRIILTRKPQGRPDLRAP